MMLLTFQNVSFGYPRCPELIVDGTFSVAPGGERLFLVGPSGTGKSTLMKLALGLLPPSSGTVKNHALRPIPITQNFYASLLPWFTVRRNLLFGAAGQHERLQTIVPLFELDAFLESRPTELSGGQLQKVLFARALCQQPDLLLVDEPLSHLDLPSSKRILTRLERFLTNCNVSVFWITHRRFEARALAHRIIHLENQSLRLLQRDELSDPQDFTT